MAKVSTHGARPGERRGGRSKGTPNKRTAALRAGLVAAGAPPEVMTPPQQQPLNFLLSAMNNNELPMATRIDAAKAAAPYLHHRLGLLDSAGRDQPLNITVLRFAADLPDEPEPLTIENGAPTAH